MAKRLVRAKRKIARRAHPVPGAAGRTSCPTGCAACCSVVYLIFNEGYAAAAGRRAGPRASCATRRSGSAGCSRELMPDEPEVHGLLALMLLQDARRAARTERRPLRPAGRAGPRPGGTGPRSAEGLAALAARCARRPGAVPAAGRDRRAPEAAERTRPTGTRVADLYARAGPDRAVAGGRGATGPPRSAFAHGPERGLALLEPLLADPALARYQPLHAAHAELLRRAGRPAAAAYQKAIELTANEVERAELRRRAVLPGGPAASS